MKKISIIFMVGWLIVSMFCSCSKDDCVEEGKENNNEQSENTFTEEDIVDEQNKEIKQYSNNASQKPKEKSKIEPETIFKENFVGSKVEEDSTNKVVKEKMISVEVPIYGKQYRYYWIKNGEGVIVWSGSTYEEQQEILNNLSNEEFVVATYGSSSKQDIVGYKTIEIPESEYENSWI